MTTKRQKTSKQLVSQRIRKSKVEKAHRLKLLHVAKRDPTPKEVVAALFCPDSTLPIGTIKSRAFFDKSDQLNHLEAVARLGDKYKDLLVLLRNPTIQYDMHWTDKNLLCKALVATFDPTKRQLRIKFQQVIPRVLPSMGLNADVYQTILNLFTPKLVTKIKAKALAVVAREEGPGLFVQMWIKTIFYYMAKHTKQEIPITRRWD